jgi:hypothetical protein
MSDELISKGISPIRWIQANVPEDLLDEGNIHKVAHAEDREPRIATILQEDMLCAHCWCDFDEANEERRVTLEHSCACSMSTQIFLGEGLLKRDHA